VKGKIGRTRRFPQGSDILAIRSENKDSCQIAFQVLSGGPTLRY
jgi:hypothetical protein